MGSIWITGPSSECSWCVWGCCSRCVERDILEAQVQRGCREQHSFHLRNGCSHLQPLVSAEKGKCRRCMQGFLAHAQQPWKSHLTLFLPAAHCSVPAIAWEKMQCSSLSDCSCWGLTFLPKWGLKKRWLLANRSPQHRTKFSPAYWDPGFRGGRTTCLASIPPHLHL